MILDPLLVDVCHFLFFIILADLDALIDVLLLKCAGNDDEIVLFLKRIAELDNSLSLDQTLREPGLTPLAVIRSW